MKDLIEFIAKKMVEHPDDVQVRLVESEAVTASETEGDDDREGGQQPSQNYELQVNPEDMGRIIGKSGRTAKAIRTLVSSAAAKANVYANLEIVE